MELIEFMLDVNNISFGYYSDKPVFSNLSFHVEKGKICGLFGPNGCGKTTLFKCCLRFLQSSNGSINVEDEEISTFSIKELARLFSYVPQEHKPSFPFLVKDVVLMGRTPHIDRIFRISKHDKQQMYDALDLVGIREIADTPYNQLSGGQRQLVIIARAVCQQAKVMFLDEPTSALDFSNQITVWKLLRKIAHKGTTVVACTHDPNHVIWFCDDVVIMGNGGIIAKGTPEEVISEEILDQIYQDTCQVSDLADSKMVYPKKVALLKKRNR